MIEPRFRAPDGWQFADFAADDGVRLRYGHAAPPGGGSNVCVILPGFAEFSEKYFETIRDMLARDIEVFILDWRGQGGSERLLEDSNKAHATDFGQQVGDLDKFMTEIVEPAVNGRPVFGQAHSFGGHCLIRFLQEHPGRFDFAAMTAPMLDIGLTGWQRVLARPLARMAVRLGLGGRYIPGAGPWEPSDKRGTADSIHSHDPVRDGLETAWYSHRPDLRIGGMTYGWLDSAFRSIDLINQENRLKGIETPVMIAMPGNEQLVSKEAQERAARLMPNAKLHRVPGAKHELWIEADRFRKGWLDVFTEFVSTTAETVRNGLTAPGTGLKNRLSHLMRLRRQAGDASAEVLGADEPMLENRSIPPLAPVHGDIDAVPGGKQTRINGRPDYEMIVHVDCGSQYPFSKSRPPEDVASKGHSFITLVDRKSKIRITKGFHPLPRIYPSKYPEHNIPHAVKMSDIGMITEPYPGGLVDETMRYTTISRRYPLSRDQFDRAYAKVGDWDIDRPDYILTKRNCNHFVYDVAKAAGISLSRFIFPNLLPHSLAVDLSLQNGVDSLRDALVSGGQKLLHKITAPGKSDDLTDNEKTLQPMQPPGSNGGNRLEL